MPTREVPAPLTRARLLAALVGVGLLGSVVSGQATSAPSTRPAGASVVLPAAEGEAKAALEKSPRHGEWENIQYGDRVVRCWVVYPEVKEKAGVVILIHEIYGLSDWMRAVADRVAAEGFIAVTPDFLSGLGPNRGGTESFGSRDEVVKAVRGLEPGEVQGIIQTAIENARGFPAANGKVATMGFCWGGSKSFEFATRDLGADARTLDGAVVYYGSAPTDAKLLAKITAPVLGFYGGDDARVTATVKPTEEAMKAAGKSYTPFVFDGAGHGFLRQQDGREGANKTAAERAWGETVGFFRERLK